MKKVIKLLTSVMLVVVFSVCAFAEDFTPSINRKPVPDLVPVTPPTGEKFENDAANSENVTVVIKGNDGKIYGYTANDENSPLNAIVITPVAKMNDETIVGHQKTDEEIKNILSSAYGVTKDISNLDELTANNKGVTEYINKKGWNFSSKDLVIRDLFDITIYSETPELSNEVENLLSEYENITMTFNLGVKDNDCVICMHKPSDPDYLKTNGMTDGDWEVIETTNNRDGSVTITLSNLSPVLFAIKTNSSTHTPSGNNPTGGHARDTGDTFNRGIYIGTMVVAAGGIILLARKKKEDK